MPTRWRKSSKQAFAADGVAKASSSGSSLAAEVTAKVVAERLVAQLEQSGIVTMRKPGPAIGAANSLQVECLETR